MYDNQLKKIKKKIDNFNYDNLRCIKPETKKLGNLVIFFSSIVILFSTRLITFSEFEYNGLKFLFNENNIFLAIIIFINSYVFIQFELLIKLEKLTFKKPDNVDKVVLLATEILEIQKKEIQKYHDLLNNSPIEFDESTEHDIDNHLEKSLELSNLITKARTNEKHSIEIQKWFERINYYFPKIIFYGSFLFIFRYYLDIGSIISLFRDLIFKHLN